MDKKRLEKEEVLEGKHLEEHLATNEVNWEQESDIITYLK